MSEAKDIARDIYKLALNTHKRTDAQMSIALHTISTDLVRINEQTEATIEKLCDTLDGAAKKLLVSIGSSTPRSTMESVGQEMEKLAQQCREKEQ